MANKMLKVLFLSRLGDNPYCDLLINSLYHRDIEVFLEDCTFGYWFLPKVLKTPGYDILHLHVLQFFLLSRGTIHRVLKLLILLFQLSIIKLLGIRIVWTVHEWKDRFNLIDTSKAISIDWMKPCFFAIDKIIVHCGSTKSEVLENLPVQLQDRITIVEHGNYIGVYANTISSQSAKAKLGISEEYQTIFLLFGGLHRSKGCFEAVDSFLQVNDSSSLLLLAGHISEDGVQQEITTKIEGCPNIKLFAHVIDDDEIQVYMNACDCVLLPYTVFTTSGVCILAASFGKPCIAPQRGFFLDSLDNETAFLYDPSESYGLKNAMINCINDKSRLINMGKCNLERAQNLSWENIAAKTDLAYRSVL